MPSWRTSWPARANGEQGGSSKFRGHARRHRAELAESGACLLNFDSFGSHLGWLELFAGGPRAMADFLGGVYARHDLCMVVNTGVMPYADHFPFVAAGVPAATLIRWNCTAGRFFHHRPDDDLSRVSAALMARVLGASLAAGGSGHPAAARRERAIQEPAAPARAARPATSRAGARSRSLSRQSPRR